MGGLQQLIWERSGEDGRVLMDLGTYPFSGSYGWVEERYGLSWQPILTNPAGRRGSPGRLSCRP